MKGYSKVDINTVQATKTNIQIYHNGVAAGANRFTSTYCNSNSLQAQPLNLSQRANGHANRRESCDLN